MPDFAEQDLLDRGASITLGVVANAEIARDAWATWEAFNNRLAEGSALSRAAKWHAPEGLGVIRRALAESAILAILRMSDHPKGNDSLSACLLRGLLANDQVVSTLVSEQWIRRDAPNIPEMILDFELSEQPERINWFKRTVPMGWGKSDFGPENRDLENARKSLLTIRHKVIAHSVDGTFDGPTIDQIRDALAISTKVAMQGSLIFLGHTSVLDSDLDQKTRTNDDVWLYFEAGLVDAHNEWLQQHGHGLI